MSMTGILSQTIYFKRYMGNDIEIKNTYHILSLKISLMMNISYYKAEDEHEMEKPSLNPEFVDELMAYLFNFIPNTR